MLFILCAVAFGLGYYVGGGTFLLYSNVTPTGSDIRYNETSETVMVVGGSIAHGWEDPNNDSYIRRAFQSLTESTNTTYNYVDRTQVGGSPTSVSPQQFQKWLNQYHPNVVVLSWGFLNDADKKTSSDKIGTAISREISAALTEGSVVLVVSPPVTEASESRLKSLTDAYVAKEFSVAKSFHSKNVYELDVLNRMRAYLAAHDQSVDLYAANSWHPNQAGHILAGELLYNDLIETFGQSPILAKHHIGQRNSTVSGTKQSS